MIYYILGAPDGSHATRDHFTDEKLCNISLCGLTLCPTDGEFTIEELKGAFTCKNCLKKARMNFRNKTNLDAYILSERSKPERINLDHTLLIGWDSNNNSKFVYHGSTIIGIVDYRKHRDHILLSFIYTGVDFRRNGYAAEIVKILMKFQKPIIALTGSSSGEDFLRSLGFKRSLVDQFGLKGEHHILAV